MVEATSMLGKTAGCGYIRIMEFLDLDFFSSQNT